MRKLVAAGGVLGLFACSNAGGPDDAEGGGTEAETSGIATASQTSDPTEAMTDSATDSASDSAPDTESSSESATETGSVTAGSPRFDVGSDDVPLSEECGCGQDGWSYLWAANADESSVSKLNTRIIDEEGRYPTHPDGGGNPSRTSVSVDAKAVVVQNRDKPSMVKIWAKEEFCDPMRNGQPGVQTSTGADDVLAFDEEDCIAWFFDYEGMDMTVQRPVQWTQGTLNQDTCEYDDQKIWAVTGDGGSTGHCGTDGVFVHRHDGETGAIEDSIHIDEADFPCSGSRGAYGGAVDIDGNFWFLGWQNDKLARVDFDSLEVELWDFNGPGYGITIDSKGRPWITWPLQRFNLVDETFTMGTINHATGIAEDGEGRMWVSDGDNLIWVDSETLAVGATIPMPDDDLPQADMIRGIAVDVDGMVWGVRRTHTTAYKIDPEFPGIVERYDGFNTAYTYSDMTGGQLQNVTCNPEG